MGEICSAASGANRPRRCHAALIALGVTLSSIASTAALADCRRPGLTILGAADEKESACAAVDAVLRYFASGGIAVDLQLAIRFQRAVFVEVANDATKSLHPIPVSGRFQARNNEIQIVGFNSPWQFRRRPWKLPWDRQLGDSILQHEIAHAVINKLLGEKRQRLPRAWHEALAYAVQIDLMDQDLRAKVLAQYPGQEAFSSTLQINDFVYGADPDGFAISAYETYVREGKLSFLKKATAFELEMIDLNDLIP